MKPAVFFDLDGTLADTIPDMADALNRLLKEEGRAPIAVENMRDAASRGGLSMVQYGFGSHLEKAHLDKLLQRFLQLYQQNLYSQTRLFPNVKKTLNQLSQQNIVWGIVTNKPTYLAEPLLNELDLAAQAACCIYGDTTKEKKPSPLPLLHAANLIHQKPENCFYVGDSERDIQAAVNAGMRPLFAAYGYGTMPTTENTAPSYPTLNDICAVLNHLSIKQD